MRTISWIKAAHKEFKAFPDAVQFDMLVALNAAARGLRADTAKPFKGGGGGVFEIALRHRGDAFRAIYAVQVGDYVYVIDAFQKKSKSGIKTPNVDVERIRQRLKSLRATR